ncbi:MAG TPA: hypothetical protein VG297_15665 [Bryobacteraceae bacterium]|nr:hypothetical protein [Bryobacteraceae bacterium]
MLKNPELAQNMQEQREQQQTAQRENEGRSTTTQAGGSVEKLFETASGRVFLVPSGVP